MEYLLSIAHFDVMMYNTRQTNMSSAQFGPKNLESMGKVLAE